jgi:xylose isomerase
MLSGKRSLDVIEAKALADNLNPRPRSGRQEEIENLLMRSIYTDQI